MAVNKDIERKQEKLLGIFDEFVRVCESNGLTYYLGGGSLIGALRHSGFIPWDDDMDVFMPRRDYEKLFEIWSKEANTDKYRLLRTDADSNYHFRCIGVVDINTTLIKKYNVDEDIMHGLFVDIIPYDGIPKSKVKHAWQLFNAVMFNIYNVQRLPNFEKSSLAPFIKFALAVVPSKKMRYKLWKRAEHNMLKYDLYETEYCKELSTNTKALKRPLPSKWFTETKFADFEGRKVRIPVGAEDYLSLIFGNYMEFPPEEERIPKHDETVLFEDLDTPYEKYRGVKYLVR